MLVVAEFYEYVAISLVSFFFCEKAWVVSDKCVYFFGFQIDSRLKLFNKLSPLFRKILLYQGLLTWRLFFFRSISVSAVELASIRSSLWCVHYVANVKIINWGEWLGANRAALKKFPTVTFLKILTSLTFTIFFLSVIYLFPFRSHPASKSFDSRAPSILKGNVSYRDS